MGNVRQVYQSKIGGVDLQWLEQFGGIMRLEGPFGVRSHLSGVSIA